MALVRRNKMEEKRALLAMHSQDYDRMLTRRLKSGGYQVVKAASVDEMLDKMGIPKNSSPDSSPTNPFAWCIMDINLGYEGGSSYEPALEIYKHVKVDVESGKLEFMAISGNPVAVSGAKNEGIPCMNKSNLTELTERIDSP